MPIFMKRERGREGEKRTKRNNKIQLTWLWVKKKEKDGKMLFSNFLFSFRFRLLLDLMIFRYKLTSSPYTSMCSEVLCWNENFMSKVTNRSRKAWWCKFFCIFSFLWFFHHSLSPFNSSSTFGNRHTCG